MEMVGLLKVYKNKQTGDYLVQATNQDPDKLIVSYDAPIPIASADMMPSAARFLVPELKKFGTVPFDEGKVKESSRADYRRFSAEHHLVWISLYDDGTVEVQPFQRTRGGGYAGMPDKKMKMKSEEMQERIVDAILDRFAFLEGE